ncbi:MAG: hypothetical protein H3Z50_07965 [archaeon]|nr:hypothetical protein [archaeon]
MIAERADPLCDAYDTLLELFKLGACRELCLDFFAKIIEKAGSRGYSTHHLKLLIKGGIINKDNLDAFICLMNNLRGHGIASVLTTFEMKRRTLKHLTTKQSNDLLMFYSDMAREKGHSAEIIIEGHLDALTKGYVRYDLSDREEIELFVSKTNAFIPELYKAYKDLVNKNDFLSFLAQSKAKITKDEFGEKEFEELLGSEIARFSCEDEKLDFMLGIYFNAIPPLDRFSSSLYKLREMLKNQIKDLEKDHREEVPNKLYNFERSYTISKIEREKDLSIDHEKYLEELKKRLTRNLSIKEGGAAEKVEDEIEKYLKGEVSNEELKKVIESYLRMNNKFQENLSQLDLTSNPYNKWKKLLELITKFAKNLLKNEIKFELKKAIERKSVTERHVHTKIIRQLKNEKTIKQGIKNILSIYDEESLNLIQEIVDEREDVSIKRKALVKDAIKKIKENIKREYKHSIPREGTVGIIWQEEISRLKEEINSYSKRVKADEITLRLVKGMPYIVWGANCGVCVSTDYKLFSDRRFILLSILDKSKNVVGFVHIFIIDVDRKKVITVPGINPSSVYLEDRSSDEILDVIIQALQDIAKIGGFKAIYIPRDPRIHSDRKAMKNSINKKNFRTITLSEDVYWSTNPSYPFNEVFVI